MKIIQKSLKNYFTTGELAKACNILRKTLLYYDNLGLIQPEIILDNGYRYYKRAQLFLLELVVTLRNIDVPLASIEAYLKHRTPENYYQLLAQQQQNIQAEITRLQSLNSNLQEYLDSIKELHDLPLAQIKLEQCSEQYLYVTPGCKANDNFKKRSLCASRLFLSLRDKLPFKEHYFGYIVDSRAMFDEHKFYGKEYFYPLKEASDKAIYRLRPAGAYLTMYFKGMYMHHSQQYLKQLGIYCQEHQLTPLSDIYVTSILNYWTNENTDDYIYKLEIRIA